MAPGGWGEETTNTTNAGYLTRPWAEGPANLSIYLPIYLSISLSIPSYLWIFTTTSKEEATTTTKQGGGTYLVVGGSGLLFACGGKDT